MSELEDLLAFQLKANGLPAPEREVRFHPTRKFRLDFFWPVHKLACEVDGGSWVGGRHTSGAGFEADCEKLSEAAIAGIRVVRVTGAMVRSGQALELIERALGVDRPRRRVA